MSVFADFDAVQSARHQRHIDDQASMDVAIEHAQEDGERYVRSLVRGQRSAELALMLDAWAESESKADSQAMVIDKLLDIIAKQAMRDARAVVLGPCTSFLEDVAVWNGEQQVKELKRKGTMQ